MTLQTEATPWLEKMARFYLVTMLISNCHSKVSHNHEAKPSPLIPVISNLKSNAILSITNAKKSKIEKYVKLVEAWYSLEQYIGL